MERPIPENLEPPLTLEINEVPRSVEVDPSVTLLELLRNELDLTAAKYGCGLEQCFACAVIADDDQVVTTCSATVEAFVGRRITTLEGLGDASALHPVQQAFVDEGAAQCGYCIPGMVIGAVALLRRNTDPSEDEIRRALAPHLCRCGSHPRILRAVRRAAELLR